MRLLNLHCRRIQTQNCVVEAPDHMADEQVIKAIEDACGNVKVTILDAHMPADDEHDPSIDFDPDDGEVLLCDRFWEDFEDE